MDGVLYSAKENRRRRTERGTMAKLIILNQEKSTEHELGEFNTLGRHPDNTVQILDRIISKTHCQVVAEDDGYIIRDLGSMNGTYVNGVRVENMQLSDGDEISIGTTKLVYRTSNLAGRQPPPTPAAMNAQAPRGNSPYPGVPTSRPVTPQQSFFQPPEVLSRVSIMPTGIDSHVMARLEGEGEIDFRPEREIKDERQLRRDYEKLRIAHELAQAVGLEPDLDRLLGKILDKTFELLAADRGVILLVNPSSNELEARAVKQKDTEEEEIVLSTTIINEVIEKKTAVLSSDAAVDSRFSAAHSIIMQGIRSTMCVPMLHQTQLLGIIHLDSQNIANAFTEKDLQILTGIANQAATAIDNAEKARKLENDARARRDFEKLLPPEIVEQVMSGEVSLERGGEARDTTVMFTDIRGFTALSDGADPQEIVAMLNDYFERMVEIIHNNRGTLDKFMGDGIMALFGAPLPHPDHAFAAVKASMEMVAEVERFNSSLLSRGKPPIGVGIGLTTGNVVTGYLGSSRSMEYTAIGDEVNMASRFCGEAKAGQVLISEETMRRINTRIESQRISITVKGKRGELIVYEVLGSSKAQSRGPTRPASWMDATNAAGNIPPYRR
jgi:adenylate cyclase